MLALLASAVTHAPLSAQRDEVSLRWGRQPVATIAYGAVRVGDHSLDELPNGGSWRMGMNEASTLSCEQPLVSTSVAGEAPVVVPPGSYRVSVHRRADDAFALVCHGAGMPTGGSDAAIAGAYASGDPTKKLEIAWTFVSGEREDDGTYADDGARPEGPTQTSLVAVAFGDNRLQVPLDVVASERERLRGGWTLHVFRWPAARLQAAMRAGAVPIARLAPRKPRRDAPAAWNLFVGEDSARLVPCMTAPTESFGFAAPQAPSAEHTVEGEVRWTGDDDVSADEASAEGTTTTEPEPGPPLELTDTDATRENLTLELAVGARTATVTVDWPR